MSRIRPGLWLSLAALTFGLALPASANAQTFGIGNAPQLIVGNVTGGDVTPDGAAPAMTQQAVDKVEATLAWGAAMRAGDVAGAKRAADTYTAKWGGPALNSQPPSKSLKTPIAMKYLLTDAYLAVNQVGQLNNYYCGPAAGYEIIRYTNGAVPSVYDGTALSQTGLANFHHMQTDYYGVTDWARGQFVTGVNRWRGNNFYVQVNAPSATLLPDVFTYSIGWYGMPFSGDTVEFVNGPHYNGHPNLLIGHWITAYAYSLSGAYGWWADSSTTIFASAAATFGYDSSSFSSFLQSNGIAY